MSIEAAIDNDVLIKAACYRLLDEAVAVFGGAGSSIGVLGAARFVVGSRLRRRIGICDPESAEASFAAFIESVIELEPTSTEVELATSIEEAAILDDLPLDSGESQLCAMVLQRLIGLMVTGDKRAIVSLEKIFPKIREISALRSRVCCMEQLVLKIVERIGVHAVRSAVCAEPHADKALTICFSCRRMDLPQEQSSLDGLRSYIEELRGIAPVVLMTA